MEADDDYGKEEIVNLTVVPSLIWNTLEQKNIFLLTITLENKYIK